MADLALVLLARQELCALSQAFLGPDLCYFPLIALENFPRSLEQKWETLL